MANYQGPGQKVSADKRAASSTGVSSPGAWDIAGDTLEAAIDLTRVDGGIGLGVGGDDNFGADFHRGQSDPSSVRANADPKAPGSKQPGPAYPQATDAGNGTSVSDAVPLT